MATADHEPLSRWRCDVCREMIDDPGEGYVVCSWDADGQAGGFKVVHGRHRPSPVSDSIALAGLLGHDGAAKLLSWLSAGPVMIANRAGRVKGCRVTNLDAFVDLFRRLQTPFYEEARASLSDGEILSDLADVDEVFPYTQGILRELWMVSTIGNMHLPSVHHGGREPPEAFGSLQGAGG